MNKRNVKIQLDGVEISGDLEELVKLMNNNGNLYISESKGPIKTGEMPFEHLKNALIKQYLDLIRRRMSAAESYIDLYSVIKFPLGTIESDTETQTNTLLKEVKKRIVV